MRTTIEIPDSLFRRLKVRAAQQGVSMKELIQQWIEKGLDSNDKPVKYGRKSDPPRIVAEAGRNMPDLSSKETWEILDQEDSESAIGELK